MSPFLYPKKSVFGFFNAFCKHPACHTINSFSVLRVSFWGLDVSNRPSKLRYQILLHTQKFNDLDLVHRSFAKDNFDAPAFLIH